MGSHRPAWQVASLVLEMASLHWKHEQNVIAMGYIDSDTDRVSLGTLVEKKGVRCKRKYNGWWFMNGETKTS